MSRDAWGVRAVAETVLRWKEEEEMEENGGEEKGWSEVSKIGFLDVWEWALALERINRTEISAKEVVSISSRIFFWYQYLEMRSIQF